MRRAKDGREKRTGKRLTGYNTDCGDPTPEDVARTLVRKNRAKPAKKTKSRRRFDARRECWRSQVGSWIG